MFGNEIQLGCIVEYTLREVVDSEARNVRRKPGQEFGDLVKVI